ncbi:MAG: amino acid adenylation domain-containing protein, partial [bacterium]|nr:amino acid adenylation domain-containing protein [bacterium]
LKIWNEEELQPLRLQYKDYADWQNNQQEEQYKKQEDYWLRQYPELPTQLQLPIDYKRPLLRSFDGASVQFTIDVENSRNLKKTAHTNGATLYMSVLAINYILLSKISGQEDIVIGTAVAARRHADLENIIGMFVNTIAVRNKPAPHKTFNTFLGELKEGLLEAFENQEYRFEDLVDKLSVPRDTARNPLFDVMYNMLNQTEYSKGELGIASEENGAYNHREASNKFDLSIISAEQGDNLYIKIEYSTQLFKQETINRFIGYFKKIIETVNRNPEIEIAKIEIIPEEEKEKALKRFNEDLTDTNVTGTIQEKILQKINQQNDAIAIEAPETKLTYRTLDTRSAAAAHWLTVNDIEKGTYVGIYTDDRVEMITLIIAILRAECVFVPLDTQLPEDAIRYQIQSTGTRVVFTDSKNEEKIVSGKEKMEAVRRVVVETGFYEENSPPPQDKNKNRYSSEDNIYVYFTSGTTGRPRGIVGKNKSLLQFIQWEIETFSIDSTTRFSQFSAVGFDAFLRDVFTPLCAGGTICIPAKNAVLMKEEELIKWIDKNEIHMIHCVPTIFRLFNTQRLAATTYRNLRNVLLAGEHIKPKEVAHWYDRQDRPAQLVNLYGVSETTMSRTIYYIRREDGQKERLPVGKPMRGTRLIIVDSAMNISPSGNVGEILIRTPYRTTGYSNDPENTQKRYIPNPFTNDPRDIVYKTGDLGRELEDGNFEYLGRKDRQVKIRGVRVELEGIENAITQLKEINEAVVTIGKNKNNENYINAYYLAPQEQPGIYLKKLLKKTLPDYMIPAFFMKMDRFPLTGSGKVDRKALPDPGKAMAIKTEADKPANEKEEKIRRIWTLVLEIDEEKIGVNDDFFYKGGNSISIIKMSSLLDKAFGTEIPLTALFLNPTIRGMAAIINKQNNTDAMESVVKLNKGIAPKNLFIFHQMQGMVYPYRKLAGMLESQFNVFGIQPVKRLMQENSGNGHTNKRRLRNKLLARYILEIKKVQEEGPYIIAGYCIGNRVAYEVVKILEDMGETVERLILFNTGPFLPAHQAANLRLKSNLRKKIKRAPTIHPVAAAWLKQEITDDKKETLQKKSKKPQTTDNHDNQIGKEEMGRQLRAMFNRIHPGDVINTPISVIRAREETRWQVGPQQWARMSKAPVTIEITDGSHQTIFNIPYVRQIAKRIKKIL